MFEIITQDPERAGRFGMYFSRDKEPSYILLDNYPWATKGTIVDVGGSHGSVATSIAERFPNVTCIVQDLSEVVAEGQARLPTKLQDRVTFMAQSVALRSFAGSILL